MFARNKKLLRSANRMTFLFVSTMSLLVSIANAANPADSPAILNNDEAGNYVVDYGVQCSADCQLKESTNFGGSWQTVASGNAEGNNLPPYVAANKPDGTYFYKTRDLEYDEDTQQGIVTYSEVSEVTVGPVNNPPTLEDQLAYDYETRLGDINADGLQDIFLNRTTVTPPNNGTVKSVILKQVLIGQAKSFDLVFPSQGQASQASSWPLVPLHLVSTDVNLDGFADIALKGIATYISGMGDQLVYSPAVAFTDAPRAIREMDQDFVDFANDLISFYKDENYFTNAAVTVVSGGFWDWSYDCSLDWFSLNGWEWICTVDWEWIPATEITTYPGINDIAASAWEKAVEADAGLRPWQSVVDWFEMQLGVNIGIGPWCVRVGPGVGNGCESAALAAVIVSLFDLIEDEDSPRMRVPNRIYITGRRLCFYPCPKHLALEFQKLTELTPTTVSARNSAGFALTGDLVALENWDDDRYFNTVTFGFVTSSSVGELDHVYFQRVRDASEKYEASNCLPYQASPAIIPGEGYNSNGYVSSLIDFTSGIATTFWGSTGQPVGWSTKLPFAWFTFPPPPCP